MVLPTHQTIFEKYHQKTVNNIFLQIYFLKKQQLKFPFFKFDFPKSLLNFEKILFSIFSKYFFFTKEIIFLDQIFF